MEAVGVDRIEDVDAVTWEDGSLCCDGGSEAGCDEAALSAQGSSTGSISSAIQFSIADLG